MARKRANGEGSITRRKDGRYQASLTVGWKYDPEKKRTRQERLWKYGTRRECRDWLDDMVARRDSGRLSGRPLKTVGDFLNAWLEEVVKPNRRAQTYESYSSFVRIHFIPALGTVPLDKLGPRHVLSLRSKAKERGVSDGTVGHLITVLGIALNVAVDWGLLSYNPASRVEKPREERQERPLLTTHQAQVLMAAVSRDRLFALYVLQLMFGLRIGEVCGLRWEDVDLDAGRLQVRHQLQRRPGGVLALSVVKTTSGRREVLLPRLAIEVLRRHRASQQEEARAYGPRWHDGDYVYTQEDGRPLEPQLLRRLFYRVLDEAGLPRVHFHDLRHAAGTRLAEDGVDVKVISAILGHANTTITRELYLHTTPRMKQDVADRLDRTFENLGLSAHLLEENESR